VILAYAFVLIVSYTQHMAMDSPSHWALPAAIALATYLVGEWLDEYVGKPFSRTIYYPILLVFLAFIGFLIGYYAFFTTFVLFGAAYPGVSFVAGTVLIMTPYWVVFPAIIAGWLVRVDSHRMFDWD